MKKKLFCALLVCLFVLLTFAGCGENGGAYDSDLVPRSLDFPDESSFFSLSYANSAGKASDVGAALSDYTPTDGTKLVKIAYATVKTEHYDETLAKIQSRISELGGHIDREEYDGYEPRNAYLTIRIPAENYKTFTSEFPTFGVLTNLSARIDDVTTTYSETAAKKAVLEEKVANYKAMLDALDATAKPETVTTLSEAYFDSLKELSAINASFDALSNKIAMSTIYLTLDEVKSEDDVAKDTIFKRISDTFMDSLRGIGEGASDVIVFLFGNLPAILLWCAILTGCFFLVRYLIRKSRDKQSGKKTEGNKRDGEQEA